MVELGTRGWPGHPQPPAGSDELQDSGQAHPRLIILRIQEVKVLILIRGHGREALHLCMGWADPHSVASGNSSMPRRQASVAAVCRRGHQAQRRGAGGQGADFDSPVPTQIGLRRFVCWGQRSTLPDPGGGEGSPSLPRPYHLGGGLVFHEIKFT